MKFLFLAFFFPSLCFAQMVVEQSNAISVIDNNATAVRNPWTGGINASQLSMLDADFDGAEDDIYIFDKAGDRILVFLGTEENGERLYDFDPLLKSDFPELHDWSILRDLNCDGKKDIVSYSSLGGGAEIWTNTGSAGQGLSFELSIPSLQTWYPTLGGFNANIYISPQDIPAFFDLEGDGDTDVLTFAVTGSLVELHLNLSMETFGECRMDTFRIANRCYGQFMEASESNEIIQDPSLYDFCFGIADPRFDGGLNGDIDFAGGDRHVGSTILAFDGSGDELPDIVLGDVGFRNLTYLENSDRPDGLVDTVIYVSPTFPSDFGAPEVDIDNFPSAFYEDVTGDGINDLIVGVNDPNLSDNKSSVWLYENFGENNAPDFNLLQKNFLQDQTIDFGEGTALAFFDYNQDGLMDMVIGSRGEYLGTASFYPILALYLNTGTLSDPAFVLEDEDWLSISSIGGNQYIRPSFGDLDGDTDDDLIIGVGSGEILWLRNTADIGQIASFDFEGTLEADGELLDVGQNSAPQLFDLNQDGLLDLVVGERNGNVNYYENIGSISNPEFTLISENLGGLNSVIPGFFVGNSYPHLYKFDNETWIALGGESGNVSTYNEIEDNLAGDFTLVENEAFGINTGLLSTPYVININNDGFPDIFSGSVGGGVLHYKGIGIVSDGLSSIDESSFILFPNPTSDYLNFSFSESDLPQSFSFKIYSAMGGVVKSGTIRDTQIFIGNLAKGVYIFELISNDSSARKKFIKK